MARPAVLAAPVTGVARPRDLLAEAGWAGYLPNNDQAPETDEARRIVTAFEAVRRRANGRHAAPASWLPDSGIRVASALSLLAGETREWAELRSYREAFVDLQAFVPDEAAAAAEGSVTGTSGAAEGRAVLAGIMRAQAVAISVLREDDRVQGAINALAGVDIVIGEAVRSLDAVDRYKSAQALGILSMFSWPAGLVAGLVVGTIADGPLGTATAIVIVIAIAVAGWVLALGPAWGSAVGSLGSRLDRRAMRHDDMKRVAVERTVAQALTFVAVLGGPFAIGLVVTIACGRLGLP